VFWWGLGKSGPRTRVAREPVEYVNHRFQKQVFPLLNLFDCCLRLHVSTSLSEGMPPLSDDVQMPYSWFEPTLSYHDALAR
jgi:hypothetical protein